jgi:hypothetical protein
MVFGTLPVPQLPVLGAVAEIVIVALSSTARPPCVQETLLPVAAQPGDIVPAV